MFVQVTVMGILFSTFLWWIRGVCQQILRRARKAYIHQGPTALDTARSLGRAQGLHEAYAILVWPLAVSSRFESYCLRKVKRLTPELHTTKNPKQRENTRRRAPRAHHLRAALRS